MATSLNATCGRQIFNLLTDWTGCHLGTRGLYGKPTLQAGRVVGANAGLPATEGSSGTAPTPPFRRGAAATQSAATLVARRVTRLGPQQRPMRGEANGAAVDR